jgi:hypothetical protein
MNSLPLGLETCVMGLQTRKTPLLSVHFRHKYELRPAGQAAGSLADPEQDRKFPSQSTDSKYRDEETERLEPSADYGRELGALLSTKFELAGLSRATIPIGSSRDFWLSALAKGERHDSVVYFSRREAENQ